MTKVRGPCAAGQDSDPRRPQRESAASIYAGTRVAYYVSGLHPGFSLLRLGMLLCIEVSICWAVAPIEEALRLLVKRVATFLQVH